MVYKLFVTIIGNRITDDLYSCFSESQAAYQPGRGPVEQIKSKTLHSSQLIEKSIEFNKPLNIIFIDFTSHLTSSLLILQKHSIVLDRTSFGQS